MNEQVKAEVKKSLAVLKNGGVILYPTDTVWGLVFESARFLIS